MHYLLEETTEYCVIMSCSTCIQTSLWVGSFQETLLSALFSWRNYQILSDHVLQYNQTSLWIGWFQETLLSALFAGRNYWVLSVSLLCSLFIFVPSVYMSDVLLQVHWLVNLNHLALLHFVTVILISYLDYLLCLLIGEGESACTSSSVCAGQLIWYW